jgi:hypothetical protein
MAKVRRRVKIARPGTPMARVHLVIAYHGPARATCTTLCGEANKRYRYAADDETFLCDHCTNVLAELVAEARKPEPTQEGR